MTPNRNRHASFPDRLGHTVQELACPRRSCGHGLLGQTGPSALTSLRRATARSIGVETLLGAVDEVDDDLFQVVGGPHLRVAHECLDFPRAKSAMFQTVHQSAGALAMLGVREETAFRTTRETGSTVSW